MHDPKEEKDPMMCGGMVWGLTPSLSRLHERRVMKPVEG